MAMLGWLLRFSFAITSLSTLLTTSAQAAYNPWSTDFFERFGVSTADKVDAGTLGKAMNWLAGQSMPDTQREKAADAFFEAYNTLTDPERRAAYRPATPEPQAAPVTPTFPFELFHAGNPYQVFGYEPWMHPRTAEISRRAQELSRWVGVTPKLNSPEKAVAAKNLTEAALILLSREKRRSLDQALERLSMKEVIDRLEIDAGAGLLPNRVYEVARVASGDYTAPYASVRDTAEKLMNEKVTATTELPIFKSDDEALPLIHLALRALAESNPRAPCPWAEGILKNEHLSDGLREELLSLVMETAMGESASDPLALVEVAATILKERPELGRGFVARARAEKADAFLKEVWTELHYPENVATFDLHPPAKASSEAEKIFQAYTGNLHLLAGGQQEMVPQRGAPPIAGSKAVKAADMISAGLRQMGSVGVEFANHLESCLSGFAKLSRDNRRALDAAQGSQGSDFKAK